MKAAGSVPVELYHLERITAILDTPAMVGVRKQFLGIDFGDADPLHKVESLRSEVAETQKRLEGLQTGGDTFCYWMLFYFDMTKNIAKDWVVIRRGDYPLYDVHTWEILPGDSLVRKIFDEGIGQAEAVIVVISEYSINKPWVREELDVCTVRKIEEGIRLIPVVIGNIERHQIPTSLRVTVWQRISNLDEYDAELSRIVSVIYGRREKPPIGRQPEYTRSDLGVVPELSPADSIVLKLCCEMEIEGGARKAFVDPPTVIYEGAERMDLHQEQIVESMEILDGRGYLRATHTMGSKVPYALSVTNFGFDEYARTYMPGYDSLIRAAGLQIVNHGEHLANAIAEAVDAPIVIVEHILETFEARGFAKFARETGPLYISRVSPELRRWLEED